MMKQSRFYNRALFAKLKKFVDYVPFILVFFLVCLRWYSTTLNDRNDRHPSGRDDFYYRYYDYVDPNNT